MWYLKLRMYILMAVLFAIVYAVVSMISFHIGITNFYFYLILSFVIMLVQYMLGPKIVEWSMGVHYIKESEYPELHQTVRSLAAMAKIPTPKIGISDLAIPNAFAFGRSIRDGRICVTRGIMGLLSKPIMPRVTHILPSLMDLPKANALGIARSEMPTLGIGILAIAARDLTVW